MSARQSTWTIAFAAMTSFLIASTAIAGNSPSVKAESPNSMTASAIAPVSQRFVALDSKETPSFRRHVVPLLGKLGCNGRACHGSFQGRGGFRLSLFGYDFKMDHEQLLAGEEPRVNPGDPEASLILQKPTLRIPHEGGERYKLGSWEHHLLLKWIQRGAPGVKDSDKTSVRLEVSPTEIRFAKKGDRASLKVIARWSDGTREDVTPLCRFQSNDEQVAAIDTVGNVTSIDAGDSHVVVFYDSAVVPIPVLRPASSLPVNEYPQVAAPTEIDRLVVKKLRKLGIVPSELCTDAEFLRRVSLDITGTLPTATEVTAFLSDKSPDKRSKKVNELLERPTYVAWWTTRLCDITGNNDSALANIAPVNQLASQDWYDWILRRVRDNVPYDKLVEGIVLATSRKPSESYTDYAREMSDLYRPKTEQSYADRPGLTHFWARRTIVQPQQKALSFAYTFLGIRIQCAECHKHPFDQWTQDDYKDFTKFFARVRFGVDPTDRNEYDTILAGINATPRTLGDLRREYPRLLAEGKTLPFDEVFVTPARQRVPARAIRPQKAKAKNAAMTAGKEPRQAAVAKRPAPPSQTKIATQTKTPTPVAAASETTRQPVVARRPMPKRQLVQRPQPNQDLDHARLLGGEQIDLSRYEDPRVPLMNWLRSDKNRYFARAFVNRVWATYFNVGIVNPPDDLSLANPPSNAELLDYLADGFVKHHYDMKWLHREIVNSRTYQMSWRPNDTNRLDQRNFSHAVPRRLPAEVAFDAVRQATSSDASVTKMQHEWKDRAIGIPGSSRRGRGGSIYALNVFGRSVRQSNCDCDRSNDPSLLQTVFLRNDNEVLAMVNDGKSGWLAQVARELSPRKTPTSPSANPKAQRPAATEAARRPVVAPRPIQKAATNAVAEVKRPEKMLEKPKDADRRSQPNQQAERRDSTRPDVLTVAQKTRRIAQLTERIRQLEAGGKTDQAKRLSRNLEEFKRRPAVERLPVIAQRPGRKGTVNQGGAQVVAIQLKPSDVPAPRKLELVRTAYLRILSRYPDEHEMARALGYVNQSDNVVGGLRDLVWALVNTREFIVNH